MNATIPFLSGNSLHGADGFRIGHFRNRILTMSNSRRRFWEKYVPICAFAIMEFGGMCDWVWVNDTDTGDIFSISLENLRKVPVDGKNRHMVPFAGGDLFLLESASDIRHQLPEWFGVTE